MKRTTSGRLPTGPAMALWAPRGLAAALVITGSLPTPASAQSAPPPAANTERASSEPTAGAPRPRQDALASPGNKSPTPPPRKALPFWQHPRFESHGLGGYTSPGSDLGTNAGVVFSRQGYGDDFRNYASGVQQLEIGRGLGLQAEGYRVFNLIELPLALSPIAGGNLFEFDGDLNTTRDSRDYLSWAMHVDAGLRIGKKNQCFAAFTLGLGLNSGTQSRGEGDWFRRETAAMLSGVCGPLAVGGSIRHIDDASGPVSHATASAVLFLDAARHWGLGTAYSLTAYAPDTGYRSVVSSPFFAWDDGERQTMLRITLQYTLDDTDDCQQPKPPQGRGSARTGGLTLARDPLPGGLW